MLEISKTSDPFVQPGATLVYTITYGNAGGSTATGWSCPDGSPAGTMCTHAVADIPSHVTQSLLFAIVVDAHPQTSMVVVNTVLVTDAEGGSSNGGDSSIISHPAPAPAMLPWAFVASLAGLLLIARRRWH